MNRNVETAAASSDSPTVQIGIDSEYVEKVRAEVRWRRRYRWLLLVFYTAVGVASLCLIEQLRALAANGLDGPDPHASLWALAGLTVGFKLGVIMTSAVAATISIFRTRRDLLICQLQDALEDEREKATIGLQHCNAFDG